MRSYANPACAAEYYVSERTVKQMAAIAIICLVLRLWERPLDIQYLYAGQVKSDGGWRIDAHHHRFYELIVVVHGAEDILLDGEPLHLSAGSALLFRPYRIHEEQSHRGAALETVYVAFRWEGSGTSLPTTVADHRGRLRELAFWINQEREAYQTEAVLARNAYCVSLVREYLRLSADRDHELVNTVRAHIRAHLAEPLTLDDLAQAAGLSKYHFLRAYRHLAGLTPMQDLRRMRLDAARSLLLSERLPLKTIAPQVGLANEYHLSRLFREHYGMTAREMRSHRP